MKQLTNITSLTPHTTSDELPLRQHLDVVLYQQRYIENLMTSRINRFRTKINDRTGYSVSGSSVTPCDGVSFMQYGLHLRGS